MGLFKTNFKGELQRLIRDIEKPNFQLSTKWVWWRKREESLLRIEREDIEVIAEIKRLYHKGRINRRLTSEILRLAIELRDGIERMRNAQDQQLQPEKIQHINNLIQELDLFLNEELVMETLGIEVNLKLYYGANTPYIKNFRAAEEDTVGRGLYLSDIKTARGYARRRGKSRGIPVVYEFRLHNLWLADLSNSHKVKVCFTHYESILREYIQKYEQDPRRYYFPLKVHRNAINLIRESKLHGGNIKLVAFGTGTDRFSQFLQEHGYDGLVTREGGEGDVGNHLSYVIFDPSKIQLLREIHIRR